MTDPSRNHSIWGASVAQAEFTEKTLRPQYFGAFGQLLPQYVVAVE
jgi:hypothetical protein